MLPPQEYHVPFLPMGMNIRINLYSTHGDFFYVGLNGMEIYDQSGKAITKEARVFAMPSGVHVLPGMEGDIRTPDKLVDGFN